MRTTTLPASALGEGHLTSSTVWQAVPLLPRNALLGLLHAYRATVSHLYGDVCKFYPTCSAYAVGAVQQHGVVKGAALSVARVVRCHPWAAGGIDDVPPHKRFRHQLTPHGFVVPPRKD
ncbi:membrane protein insertion efficiency factor YidD [Microbacterium sp.]|uniref:membrane protein insertion efficiency factor YidD n=1 Tax=Microbacterium sp. TaxID=51671 RepID=UPI003A8519AB